VFVLPLCSCSRIVLRDSPEKFYLFEVNITMNEVKVFHQIRMIVFVARVLVRKFHIGFSVLCSSSTLVLDVLIHFKSLCKLILNV
jgi:hypothetical protein